MINLMSSAVGSHWTSGDDGERASQSGDDEEDDDDEVDEDDDEEDVEQSRPNDRSVQLSSQLAEDGGQSRSREHSLEISGITLPNMNTNDLSQKQMATTSIAAANAQSSSINFTVSSSIQEQVVPEFPSNYGMQEQLQSNHNLPQSLEPHAYAENEFASVSPTVHAHWTADAPSDTVRPVQLTTAVQQNSKDGGAQMVNKEVVAGKNWEKEPRVTQDPKNSNGKSQSEDDEDDSYTAFDEHSKVSAVVELVDSKASLNAENHQQQNTALQAQQHHTLDGILKPQDRLELQTQGSSPAISLPAREFDLGQSTATGANASENKDAVSSGIEMLGAHPRSTGYRHTATSDDDNCSQSIRIGGGIGRNRGTDNAGGSREGTHQYEAESVNANSESVGPPQFGQEGANCIGKGDGVHGHDSSSISKTFPAEAVQLPSSSHKTAASVTATLSDDAYTYSDAISLILDDDHLMLRGPIVRNESSILAGFAPPADFAQYITDHVSSAVSAQYPTDRHSKENPQRQQQLSGTSSRSKVVSRDGHSGMSSRSDSRAHSPPSAQFVLSGNSRHGIPPSYRGRYYGNRDNRGRVVHDSGDYRERVYFAKFHVPSSPPQPRRRRYYLDDSGGGDHGAEAFRTEGGNISGREEGERVVGEGDREQQQLQSPVNHRSRNHRGRSRGNSADPRYENGFQSPKRNGKRGSMTKNREGDQNILDQPPWVDANHTDYSLRKYYQDINFDYSRDQGSQQQALRGKGGEADTREEFHSMVPIKQHAARRPSSAMRSTRRPIATLRGGGKEEERKGGGDAAAAPREGSELDQSSSAGVRVERAEERDAATTGNQMPTNTAGCSERVKKGSSRGVSRQRSKTPLGRRNHSTPAVHVPPRSVQEVVLLADTSKPLDWSKKFGDIGRARTERLKREEAKKVVPPMPVQAENLIDIVQEMVQCMSRRFAVQITLAVRFADEHAAEVAQSLRILTAARRPHHKHRQQQRQQQELEHTQQGVGATAGAFNESMRRTDRVVACILHLIHDAMSVSSSSPSTGAGTPSQISTYNGRIGAEDPGKSGLDSKVGASKTINYQNDSSQIKGNSGSKEGNARLRSALYSDPASLELGNAHSSNGPKISVDKRLDPLIRFAVGLKALPDIIRRSNNNYNNSINQNNNTTKNNYNYDSNFSLSSGAADDSIEQLQSQQAFARTLLALCSSLPNCRSMIESATILLWILHQRPVPSPVPSSETPAAISHPNSHSKQGIAPQDSGVLMGTGDRHTASFVRIPNPGTGTISSSGSCMSTGFAAMRALQRVLPEYEAMSAAVAGKSLVQAHCGPSGDAIVDRNSDDGIKEDPKSDGNRNNNQDTLKRKIAKGVDSVLNNSLFGQFFKQYTQHVCSVREVTAAATQMYSDRGPKREKTQDSQTTALWQMVRAPLYEAHEAAVCTLQLRDYYQIYHHKQQQHRRRIQQQREQECSKSPSRSYSAAHQGQWVTQTSMSPAQRRSRHHLTGFGSSSIRGDSPPRADEAQLRGEGDAGERSRGRERERKYRGRPSSDNDAVVARGESRSRIRNHSRSISRSRIEGADINRPTSRETRENEPALDKDKSGALNGSSRPTTPAGVCVSAFESIGNYSTAIPAVGSDVRNSLSTPHPPMPVAATTTATTGASNGSFQDDDKNNTNIHGSSFVRSAFLSESTLLHSDPSQTDSRPRSRSRESREATNRHSFTNKTFGSARMLPAAAAAPTSMTSAVLRDRIEGDHRPAEAAPRSYSARRSQSKRSAVSESESISISGSVSLSESHRGHAASGGCIGSPLRVSRRPIASGPVQRVGQQLWGESPTGRAGAREEDRGNMRTIDRSADSHKSPRASLSTPRGMREYLDTQKDEDPSQHQQTSLAAGPGDPTAPRDQAPGFSASPRMRSRLIALAGASVVKTASGYCLEAKEGEGEDTSKGNTVEHTHSAYVAPAGPSILSSALSRAAISPRSRSVEKRYRASGSNGVPPAHIPVTTTLSVCSHAGLSAFRSALASDCLQTGSGVDSGVHERQHGVEKKKTMCEGMNSFAAEERQQHQGAFKATLSVGLQVPPATDDPAACVLLREEQLRQWCLELPIIDDIYLAPRDPFCPPIAAPIPVTTTTTTSTMAETAARQRPHDQPSTSAESNTIINYLNNRDTQVDAVSAVDGQRDSRRSTVSSAGMRDGETLSHFTSSGTHFVSSQQHTAATSAFSSHASLLGSFADDSRGQEAGVYGAGMEQQDAGAVIKTLADYPHMLLEQTNMSTNSYVGTGNGEYRQDNDGASRQQLHEQQQQPQQQQGSHASMSDWQTVNSEYPWDFEQKEEHTVSSTHSRPFLDFSSNNLDAQASATPTHAIQYQFLQRTEREKKERTEKQEEAAAEEEEKEGWVAATDKAVSTSDYELLFYRYAPSVDASQRGMMILSLFSDLCRALLLNVSVLLKHNGAGKNVTAQDILLVFGQPLAHLVGRKLISRFAFWLKSNRRNDSNFRPTTQTHLDMALQRLFAFWPSLQISLLPLPAATAATTTTTASAAASGGAGASTTAEENALRYKASSVHDLLQPQCGEGQSHEGKAAVYRSRLDDESNYNSKQQQQRHREQRCRVGLRWLDKHHVNRIFKDPHSFAPNLNNI